MDKSTLAESDLKKLQVTSLGRIAGRVISSHVHQFFSWITASMQRAIMNIPGWLVMSCTWSSFGWPFSSARILPRDSSAILWGMSGRRRDHLSKNRSQSRSERATSRRRCKGLDHLQLVALYGLMEEEGWAHRACLHEKVGDIQLFFSIQRRLVIEHLCYWQRSCQRFREVSSSLVSAFLERGLLRGMSDVLSIVRGGWGRSREHFNMRCIILFVAWLTSILSSSKSSTNHVLFHDTERIRLQSSSNTVIFHIPATHT